MDDKPVMKEELPRIPEAGGIAMAAAFAFIMCFGGISNALVVVTHINYRKRMLKEAKDVAIFSLAIGDLIMTSLVCPLGFSSAVAVRWTTGEAGCKWYAFVATWIGLSSMTQLAVIALERYYTLAHPNMNAVPRKQAIQAIVTSWLIALVASCLPFFGWSQYTFEGFGLHCSITWSRETKKYAWYCLLLLVVFFAIPTTIILVSYGMMFRVVRRIYRNASRMWGEEARATRQSYTAQVKFTRQIFVVTAGFFFAWSPYAVMSMLRAFTDLEFEVGYYELPALFAKTSNIYNPIIYFFMYKRLRKNSFEMLKSVWNKMTG